MGDALQWRRAGVAHVGSHDILFVWRVRWENRLSRDATWRVRGA